MQKGLSKRNNLDFSYYERKTFCKNVPNATNFLFDLGMESGMERPLYINVGFENNNVNEKLMMQVHLMKSMLLNVIVRLVVSFIPRIE